MADGFHEKLSRLFHEKLLRLLVLTLGLLLAQGCAISPRPPDQAHAPPAIKPSSAPPALLPQTGVASWYGAQHQGKQTASGKLFDQAAFTAAHRSLPFGSKVKVTNLVNGKSVEVEIIDRGPFAQNRIIDLSQAAAKALEILDSGTATVRIEQPSGR